MGNNNYISPTLARQKAARFIAVTVFEVEHQDMALVWFAQPVHRDDAACESGCLALQLSPQISFDGFLFSLPAWRKC